MNPCLPRESACIETLNRNPCVAASVQELGARQLGAEDLQLGVYGFNCIAVPAQGWDLGLRV